ncbi:hypothetical protein DPEC_G00144450 [Dallia pectoralis]|uniref:Uncharacterized protein n=1 Tax=Dallia pectoralis TaxID=75939 RepID=A0ACC2GNU7_DALPE|nr:hypothetical protein DPEC_G00144450 [Dallia pectoralis]
MENRLACVLGLVLLYFPTDLFGSVMVAPGNHLAVGSNVTLTIDPQIDINAGTWTHEKALIVLFFDSNEKLSANYRNRVSFNRTSLELSIRSLQLNDSGQYILQGIDPAMEIPVTLIIQDPISNVTLKANSINVVEHNDTVSFTCSESSGTSPSYRWLNGSSVVTAGDGVRLTDGNSTLVLDNVTRYDEGPFKCEVFNKISNGTSQPIQLNIRYGPSDLTVVLTPETPVGHTAYRAGSNITLSCSAQSKPPALYAWNFNGLSLENRGPQLSLKMVTVNQTGSYTCLAHNNVTLRSAERTTFIRAVVPITAVSLKRVGKLPIQGEPFTLRCEVTGPVANIYWRMDGKPISPNNKTFSLDNTTMVINSTTFSDGGDYHCEAVNAASNMTSQAYQLLVNFGPETPAITSVNISKTEERVTFTCSASSQPTSQFSWFFKGSRVATGPVYETCPLTLASNGVYTCEAFNNVTGRTSNATKMLTVTEAIKSVTVNQSTIAIASHNLTLTCDVNGTSNAIYWMKNNRSLEPSHTENSTIFLSNNNKSLHFVPVQSSDDGNYQCVATYLLYPHLSPQYQLLVDYGPVSVNISLHGPLVNGSQITFTMQCHAESRPTTTYHWRFNNQSLPETSSSLVVAKSMKNEGNYTCLALNPVTKIEMSSTFNLNVSDHSPAPPFLSSVGLILILLALSQTL